MPSSHGPAPAADGSVPDEDLPAPPQDPAAAMEAAASDAAIAADLTHAQERLEDLVLGGPRRYTRNQTAQLAGVPLDEAKRLWRAIGFPDAGDDEVIFTDADVAALEVARELVDEQILDEDSRLAVTRMYGQALSRLAQSQAQFMLRFVLEHVDQFTDEDELVGFVERLLPALEHIQNYVWRRQLASYGGRTMRGVADGEAEEVTVGFADITGFTSLTRRSDETGLDELLRRFEDVASDAVVGHGGRIVKSLGDEVLFVADTPVQGARIALDLLDLVAADEIVPALRVGLALGPVLDRLGDVYGATVNIASRLTSLARPGTALVDRTLAAALQDEPGLALHAMRPVSVRGYRRLHPATLRRA